MTIPLSLAGQLNTVVQQDQARVAAETAAADKKKEALTEAAQAFESMFLEHLFSEISSDSSSGGFGGEMYQDMMHQSVADVASKRGGIGIAELLVKHWSKNQTALDNTETQPAQRVDITPTIEEI